MVGGGWGGSHTHYRITPVPILGAGALMLNAWDWTVTIYLNCRTYKVRRELKFGMYAN